MQVLIPVTIKSEPQAKITDKAIIDADAYYAARRLKKAQVFIISIRDIQYEAKKAVKAEIDPKRIPSQKYHVFCDIFSMKNSDTLLPH